VEDINLVNTTLRYARTNEVSIVSNSSITASRIINCNRSPNALVVFEMLLHISFLEEGKLSAFENALTKFVKEHPRAWDRLMFVRRDEVDADDEKVQVTIQIRHRSSWQDAGRILVQRGNLIKFVHETAVRLKIVYSSPPHRRLLYRGGTLKDGRVQDYKANLLQPNNIRSHSASFDQLPASFSPPPTTRDAQSASHLPESYG